MDDENNHIHGNPEDVLRQLAEEVRAGRMTPEQLAELAVTLGAQAEAMHDVSVGFRVALIAQGFESVALKLVSIHMALTEAGAMFQYTVGGGEAPDWLDSLDEATNRAFLTASVMVLRAGNINAEISADNLRIDIRGHIVGHGNPDQDAIINDFIAELDQIFPDVPPSAPPRKGEWW